MRINVTLPFDQFHDGDEFLKPEAVTEIGATMERVGFAGCNVTDHPCPSGRWLDAGGHHAQDPFVMLSLVAMATRTVRLQTGILVLPYRNPFITARAVATLDVFSRGRVTLGIGAGYMKGEYFALGVDFERRHEIVDEYIDALKAAWAAHEFSFKGANYEARGNRILPRPVQMPHPPLLIGGNSHRAIRRAVEKGDAWYPFFTAPGVSTTSRTAKERTARFKEAIDLIRRLWSEEQLTYEGTFYRTANATIYDRPDVPVPIYIAAAGPVVAKFAGDHGDGFICTSGKPWELYTQTLLPSLQAGLERAGKTPRAFDRMIEIKLSFDTDRERALQNTRFWGALALRPEEKLNVENPLEMERLADALPVERAASRWIVSDDPDETVQWVGQYVELGFNHLVFHAPGPDQGRFLKLFAEQIAPRLRAKFG